MTEEPEYNSDSLLLNEPDTSRAEEQIQELQEEIARELDARMEERLIWILVVIILLDVYLFTSMDSIMGPLVIGIFQLLAFILIARKLGMEQIIQLIDGIIAVIAKGVSRGN